MASIFKRKGEKRWTIAWNDHDGLRQERASGTTEKRLAERIGNAWGEGTFKNEGIWGVRTQGGARESLCPGLNLVWPFGPRGVMSDECDESGEASCGKMPRVERAAKSKGRPRGIWAWRRLIRLCRGVCSMG
mgnify:CR=1 FL=1